MQTEVEQRTAEINRIREQTQAGLLKWELVPDCDCSYQLNIKYTTAGKPHCVVSCCKPEYEIKVEGKRLDVPDEDIMLLCNEIIGQINRMKVQETTALLRTVTPIMDVIPQ
jgi:hypothetical protein